MVENETESAYRGSKQKASINPMCTDTYMQQVFQMRAREGHRYFQSKEQLAAARILSSSKDRFVNPA